MKRAMLPLNALRAFDAAARNLSFKQAAEDLAVTPAAISQQIRHLEEVIGRDLFVRSNRSLKLTEWGEAAKDEVAEAFASLELATSTMKTLSPAINQPPAAASNVYRLSA